MAFKLERHWGVMVDVDGTLTEGETDVLRPRVVAAVKKLVEEGQAVVIWSGRGKANAERACRLAGITGVTCCSKPRVVVDDVVGRKRRSDKPDPWWLRFKTLYLTPEEFAEGSWRKR